MPVGKYLHDTHINDKNKVDNTLNKNTITTINNTDKICFFVKKCSRKHQNVRVVLFCEGFSPRTQI